MTTEHQELGCPECNEATTFLLEITGKQEKAAYAEINGEPSIQQAGSVTVESHDPDHLKCRSCGSVVSEDDLVPVEVN